MGFIGSLQTLQNRSHVLSAKLLAFQSSLCKRREKGQHPFDVFLVFFLSGGPNRCKVPRAKAGFKILAASRVESIPLPEPMMVWSSTQRDYFTIFLETDDIVHALSKFHGNVSPQQHSSNRFSKTHLGHFAGVLLIVQYGKSRARVAFRHQHSHQDRIVLLVFRLKIEFIQGDFVGLTDNWFDMPGRRTKNELHSLCLVVT